MTIAIIAVLVSLLGAVVGQGWEVAIDVQCKHNLNQLYQALHLGRDVTYPSPLYWVGFIESVGCAESLICPKGDTSRPDPAAPKPVNPYASVVQNDNDDAPLPPLPPDESCPEQDIEPIRPPASVKLGAQGALESSTVIREFTEQKDFVLPSAVRTNISGPGYYNSPATMTGGTIAAGTHVNCYFLHFDPVGSGGAQVMGRMNFNGDILGIICRDAELDGSDAVLGNPGTKYPTGTSSRGFEANQEVVTVSNDRRTLTINRFYSSTVGEQMRVIVAAKAKNDPAQGWVGGGGSGGSVGYGAWDSDSEYDVGGPTSYAMNTRATPSDAWPGQVLLVEYRRTIADLILNGTSVRDALSVNLAPRHSGRVNTLFVDGRVEGLTPEELMPDVAGQPWVGGHGDRQTP